MSTAPQRRIAIACQGGGSHTAFTAGVLGRLLRGPELDGAEVVGLSGTSGGAICAMIAWEALRDGDARGAADRLDAFWADNAASLPHERLLNASVVATGVLRGLGLVPAISPYALPPFPDAAGIFRSLLARHVDLDRIEIDREGVHPLLLLGAVDVRSGAFRTFSSRADRLTADSVLASAAIPQVFRAVHTEGGTYWDGLFSQNPPVRDLLVTEPDELWVVQVNPQRVEAEPMTLTAIEDRRNELSGNLSLHQELGFVETIDGLLDAGHISPDAGYKQIRIRVLEMPRQGFPRSLLGPVSKLDRDWSFIRGLLEGGAVAAEVFLAAWRFERAWRADDLEAVLALVHDDAEIVAEVPFPPVDADRRTYLETLLGRSLAVDATRKQVVEETATWQVRLRTGPDDALVLGVAELSFRDGLVAAMRLGPAG